MLVIRALACVSWLASAGLFSRPAYADEPVDFTRDVLPILSQSCVRCHGPDKQESSLRLDMAAFIMAGGNNGPAAVAGASGESLLIQAITGANPDLKMPPEGEGEAPNESQIALLKTWIDQGAIGPAGEAVARLKPGKDHWSFRPVARGELPPVANPAWVKNPIDAFILARLEKEGIQPSPEADRATLIRRLSFDLIGLPPSPAEVDEFVADTRPDAYEQLVERLLASPHYGEQWGRHWLDLARYADSNGFTIDGPRSIWKYRDWVIAAFNRDLPFDQFTIEQIAGDMLPSPTTDQIVATGFHRNTLINQEGGTDPEQFRVESVVDRVNTTGSVFLGLTIGCAQCHTHKYDPISQREYYQFYAFFNNADEPTIVAPSVEQAQQLASYRQEIASAEQALADHDAAMAPRQAEWEKQYSASRESLWTVLDPVELRSAGGALMTRLEDRSVLVGGSVPANDTYTVVAKAPAGAITAVRVEALTHNTLSNRGPGLSETGNFVLTDFDLTLPPPAAAQPAVEPAPQGAPVVFSRVLVDDARPEWPAEHAIDDSPTSGWSFNFTQGVPNTEHRAVFITKEEVATEAGAPLTFTIAHQHLMVVRSAFGRFQLSVTSAARDAVALDEALRAILKVPADQRTPSQREQLAAEFQKSDPARTPMAALTAEAKSRERELVGAITTTMVMQERAEPRETHIQLRGDFLHPGARVEAAVPAILPPLPGDIQNPSRLDLARWLVDAANPLTGRVTMNRFWLHYFGVGLSEIENDFGAQGSPPSHPELLDWLAAEFVARGWSMKAMHRLLVTSATYRQASHARPDLATIDPRNKLLARQARLRLEAENIRDVGLATSGLLSREIGGPGVFPPQPAGIYRFTQQDKQWKDGQGGDRFRRGLYTYFWRSSPYPFLMTFDAPNGNVTCTRRARSNTPLQALTLANDAAFVEMAQALAARALREAPSPADERLRHVFRLCLARAPTEGEHASLAAYYQSQLGAFEAAPADAEAVAPADRPAGVSLHEAAATAAVARVLLNLDEFITRE